MPSPASWRPTIRSRCLTESAARNPAPWRCPPSRPACCCRKWKYRRRPPAESARRCCLRRPEDPQMNTDKHRLWFLALLCAVPLWGADGVVMKAMRDELARSMERLKDAKLDTPYFIAYRVRE